MKACWILFCMKPTSALYNVWFRRDTTLKMINTQIFVVARRTVGWTENQSSLLELIWKNSLVEMDGKSDVVVRIRDSGWELFFVSGRFKSRGTLAFFIIL